MKVIPLRPFREANPNVACPHFIATNQDVEESTIMNVPEEVRKELLRKGAAVDVTNGEEQVLKERESKSNSETNSDDNADDKKVSEGKHQNGWGNK